MRRFPVGLRYMAASAFFFSLMSVSVKVAGARIPTMQIVLARGVVTAALTGIWMRKRGIDPRRPRGRTARGLLILRGVLGLVAMTCFYFAVAQMPLAEANVLHFTNPVFTAFLAALLLREPLARIEVGLALLGLIGVVLVVRPGFRLDAGAGHLPAIGVAAGLAGALFTAAAYVALRRASRVAHPLVIVFYFAVISIVGSVPVAVSSWVAPTPLEWAALMGVGVFTQAGQVLLTMGLSREPAGRATAMGYLQVAFAMLWGWLLFGEWPPVWSLAGAAVILACTVGLGRVATVAPTPATLPAATRGTRSPTSFRTR